MPTIDDPFTELAALVLVAAILGVVATLLRQPLIVAFLVVGILVGPAALDLIQDIELWEVLATVGISLLLFVVGLRLDVQEIRRTGLVALSTGLGGRFDWGRRRGRQPRGRRKNRSGCSPGSG